jgi:hypothetical protein
MSASTSVLTLFSSTLLPSMCSGCMLNLCYFYLFTYDGV